MGDKLLRPVAALVSAVLLIYALPLFIAVLLSPSSSTVGAQLAIMMALIFAWPVLILFPLVLSFVRRGKWPRLWTDAILAAACAMCTPAMMVISGDFQLSGVSSILYLTLTFALFAGAGALTGALYWLLAGRPVHLTPPASRPQANRVRRE